MGYSTFMARSFTMVFSSFLTPLAIFGFLVVVGLLMGDGFLTIHSPLNCVGFLLIYGSLSIFGFLVHLGSLS